MIVGRARRIQLVHWFGGKGSHLDFILPLLPRTPTYIEPFGGSGAVLLNRPRSEREIYNDLYEPVVNLMRVTRDDPASLSRMMRLTPYARREFMRMMGGGFDDLHRAHASLCIALMSRESKQHGGDSSWARSKRWHGGTRRGRVGAFRMDAKRRVLAAGARLQGVEIECRDALDVIRDHDSKGTLFYLDPPYVLSTRSSGTEYGEYEMSDDGHRRLAELLNGIQGLAAVSGYESPLYEELYPRSRGWVKAEGRDKGIKFGGGRKVSERLWVNYGSGRPHGGRS